MFINTDERPWLAERVAEFEAMSYEERRDKHGIHGNWTIVYIPLDAGDHDTDNYHHAMSWKTRGGTKSGVHFFVGLELMRQCEAFVANFHSAMAGTFYQLMCSRHSIILDLETIRDKLYIHL